MTNKELEKNLKGLGKIMRSMRCRKNFDFTELIEQIISLNLGPRDKMKAIICEHTKFVGKNAYILEIIFRDRSALPEKELEALLREENTLATEIQKIFQEGVSEGTFKNIDPKVGTYLLLGACNWLMFWYHPEGEIDIEKMSEIVSSLLADGYLRNQKSF